MIDKTFIKDLIFIILVLFILANIYIENSQNRYTIFNGHNGVILLDKKTGLTWRQVEIDDTPAYWEEMLNICDENTLVPIGKKQKLKKGLKQLNKEEK